MENRLRLRLRLVTARGHPYRRSPGQPVGWTRAGAGLGTACQATLARFPSSRHVNL